MIFRKIFEFQGHFFFCTLRKLSQSRLSGFQKGFESGGAPNVIYGFTLKIFGVRVAKKPDESGFFVVSSFL